MNHQSINDQLLKFRLVPVVSLPTVAAGVRLAGILLKAGLPVMEITYRTACAVEALGEIKRTYPDLLLIAGTVLTPAQVDSAVEAGAQAVVSPGFTSTLAAYCSRKNMPLYPGVCTPSEVQMAVEMGLQVLKFFPAEQAGGLKMLAMFKTIYQDIRFMPTGGISLSNLLDYLRLDNIVCCGGTWLCPEQLMIEGRWDEIEARLGDVVQLLNTII